MQRVINITLVLVVLIISSCSKDKNPVGPNDDDVTRNDITFVSIPGGSFLMGNTENFQDVSELELPVHTVTLSAYKMSTFEITNSQYVAFINEMLESETVYVHESYVWGVDEITENWTSYCQFVLIHDPSYQYLGEAPKITYSNFTLHVDPGYEDYPVVYVTWYGAKAFANYYGLDLPTEAEWEYACRGGMQYQYGTEDGTINSANANYNANIGHAVDVGSFPANTFGLHDMSGNVWEWCHDWFDYYPGETVTNPTGPDTMIHWPNRVVRGGSFNSDEMLCRSALRNDRDPDDENNYIGFRVVRRDGGVIY